MGKFLPTYRIRISRDYILEAEDAESAADKAFDEFRDDLKHMYVNCDEFEYTCAELDEQDLWMLGLEDTDG